MGNTEYLVVTSMLGQGIEWIFDVTIKILLILVLFQGYQWLMRQNRRP